MKKKTVPFCSTKERVTHLKKGENVFMKDADYDTGRRDWWWFTATEDCFLIVPTSWFHDDKGKEWIQPTSLATISIWQASFDSDAEMALIADIDNKRYINPRIYSPDDDREGALWVLPERRQYLYFLRERREKINELHKLADELKKMGANISVLETELH